MKIWTKEQTSLLRENMDRTLNTLKELFPDKSEEQIIEKIKLIYRQAPAMPYTDDEKNTIRNNPKLTVYELMKLLPNRSMSSIQYKKYELLGPQKLRHDWTEAEIKTLTFLKSEGYTMHEISEVMCKSLNAVMGAAYKNNLVKRQHEKRIVWTEDRENIVREGVANKKTVEELAEILGTTLKKVVNKALHLGFTYKEILTNVKKERGDRTLNIKVRDEKIKQLHKEISGYKKDIKKLTKELAKSEDN